MNLSIFSKVIVLFFGTKSENTLASNINPDDFVKGSTERKDNMVWRKGI